MSLLDTASLIVTPNGYKEGKLYSVIPSDGSGDLSVTRATTATRVNSAGLVELVPYNLLQYSQDFSNAYWFPEPGNSVTSNTTAAPDGTTTADTFTATSGNGMNVHNFNSFNLPDGTFTYSIYLKNNGTNLIEAYLFKIGSGFAARGEINFSAETFTASIGTGTIANVGNGWYRVTLTNTYTAGSFTTGTFTTSTTGTRSVFAWGAQLVEGSTAKDYQKTETRLNIPRLDYSNGTCPSLLVEPQRTNLALYSSSFDNAYWNKSNVTVTANSTDSPSGVQDADTLTKSTAGVDGFMNRFISASASTYTSSVYIKKDSNQTRFPEIFLRSSSDNGENEVYVQLNTATGATAIRFQNGTAVVNPPILVNGFWRVTITIPATANTCILGIRPAAGTTLGVFDINATGSVVAWGFQLEVGSYATSYIPTTSASVTRNADVISKTGISSLIGQTEGTIFADFIYLGGLQAVPIELSNAASNDIINVYITSSGTTQSYMFDGGSQVGFINSSHTFVQGNRYKLAIGYASNDFVLYINGAQIGNATPSSIPTLSEVYISSDKATSYLTKTNFNSAALWKTRLTNTQLAQLTSI
jgi:hypothetical protein